jgi:hypothetical protein
MTRTFAYELPSGVTSPLAAAAPHALRAAEADKLRSREFADDRRSLNASASPASVANQSALQEQRVSLDRKKSSMALRPESNTCELFPQIYCFYFSNCLIDFHFVLLSMSACYF